MKGKKLKKIHVICSKDLGTLIQKNEKLIFNKKAPNTSSGIIRTIQWGGITPKFFDKEEAEKILKEIKETNFINTDNVQIKRCNLYNSYIRKMKSSLYTNINIIKDFEKIIKDIHRNKIKNLVNQSRWRTKDYAIRNNIQSINSIFKVINFDLLKAVKQ